MAGDRFTRATLLIDTANAADPNRLVHRGEERPKELLHAELASQWVRRLRPDADEALLLAARAHHLRRWELPRSEYPEGRPGYLRWRRVLQQRHADAVAEILRVVGYETETVERVQDLVRKRGLGRDADVQAIEDALCLVFLETQLEDFAGKHPHEKGVEVLRKTLKKMSDEATLLAHGLDLAEGARELLEEALRASG
ncbi:MAG: DUF4202 domain-containing protein [Deltaproteobacteria bacterium]|nr:DUF4202 domain-containing protein [Deltaproteobacteria bacterium]